MTQLSPPDSRLGLQCSAARVRFEMASSAPRAPGRVQFATSVALPKASTTASALRSNPGASSQGILTLGQQRNTEQRDVVFIYLSV